MDIYGGRANDRSNIPPSSREIPELMFEPVPFGSVLPFRSWSSSSHVCLGDKGSWTAVLLLQSSFQLPGNSRRRPFNFSSRSHPPRLRSARIVRPFLFSALLPGRRTINFRTSNSSSPLARISFDGHFYGARMVGEIFLFGRIVVHKNRDTCVQ